VPSAGAILSNGFLILFAGVTRDRLTSLRKNFGTALDRAGVAPSDREAVLGHSRGFSLDTYSTGPGLKRLKDMVEAATYPLV
jgi:hypothetical protein